MKGDTELMNVFDAAAFLGVHVQTLRKLARKRKIPAFKVGRDWRFRKEALLRWSEEQPQTGGHDHDGCTVLIVDDEEQVSSTLTKMVERIGCRARPAMSASLGLELVAQEAPDLILLDLVMPDMNGPQFLEDLRKTHPDLPVVIVTGYPDSDLMTKASQYAPLMLITKPVERTLLDRTIRTVVGERLSPPQTSG